MSSDGDRLLARHREEMAELGRRFEHKTKIRLATISALLGLELGLESANKRDIRYRITVNADPAPIALDQTYRSMKMIGLELDLLYRVGLAVFSRDGLTVGRHQELVIHHRRRLGVEGEQK